MRLKVHVYVQSSWWHCIRHVPSTLSLVRIEPQPPPPVFTKTFKTQPTIKFNSLTDHIPTVVRVCGQTSPALTRLSPRFRPHPKTGVGLFPGSTTVSSHVSHGSVKKTPVALVKTRSIPGALDVRICGGGYAQNLTPRECWNMNGERWKRC